MKRAVYEGNCNSQTYGINVYRPVGICYWNWCSCLFHFLWLYSENLQMYSNNWFI